MLTLGRGRCRVWVEKRQIGEDILLILGGGEKTHIGSVVVCRPGEEAIVIRLGKHYDYQVLKPLAENVCKRYNVTTVAIGGIHIDNASKEEIERIIENCKILTERI